MAILARAFVPLAIGLGLASRLAAQAQPAASATEVKAAYLLNFARYVEWPPGTFSDSAAPLLICVVESDALQDALRRVAAGRTVNGHPVRLQVVRSAEEPVTCHVAYFDASHGPSGHSLETLWAGQPVLTVGEGEDFLGGGGMIGFVVVEQTVRFAINQEAAARARLRVSSRVLALALPR